MNKLVPTTVAILSIVFPAGMALAKGIELPSVNASVNAGLHVETESEEHGNTNANKTSGEVEVNEHASATSTERNKGAWGDEKSGVHASSSASSSVSHGKSDEGRGVPFFLRWLFGLAPSTTVGEIRAQIEATSTASTTNNNSGLGFFARLFSFFHWGQ